MREFTQQLSEKRRSCSRAQNLSDLRKPHSTTLSCSIILRSHQNVKNVPTYLTEHLDHTKCPSKPHRCLGPLQRWLLQIINTSKVRFSTCFALKHDSPAPFQSVVQKWHRLRLFWAFRQSFSTRSAAWLSQILREQSRHTTIGF